MAPKEVLDFMLTFVVVVSIAGFVGILILLHKVNILRTSKPSEGTKGSATVLQVEPDMSREASGMAELKLVLEIRPRGQPSYEIRTKRKIPVSQVNSLFQVGQQFEIIITGEDMSQIAIVGFDPIPNAYAGARFGL